MSCYLSREKTIDKLMEIGHTLSNKNDLDRKALCGFDLSDCDFSNASLMGANFSKSNLTNADFSDAGLCGANFINCDVEGIILDGANLTRIQIDEKTADILLKENRKVPLSEKQKYSIALAAAMHEPDKTILDNEERELVLLEKESFLAICESLAEFERPYDEKEIKGVREYIAKERNDIQKTDAEFQNVLDNLAKEPRASYTVPPVDGATLTTKKHENSVLPLPSEAFICISDAKDEAEEESIHPLSS